MPKKVKFITSTLALLVGFFIFGSSLLMASQIRSNDSPRVSERKFYMGKRILPDHVFYPVLMVIDRMILFSSFGSGEIYVKMRLANDRLISSKILLENGQEELALSTMTKSQKYLISAVQDYLQNDDKSESLRKDLLNSVKQNYGELKDCKNDFKVIDTTPIGDLLTESEVLIGQLK